MGHQVVAKVPRQIAQGKFRHARNLLLLFPATHREAGHAQLGRNLLLCPVKFKPELCKLIPRHAAKNNTMSCTMSRLEISLHNYRLRAGTLRVARMMLGMARRSQPNKGDVRMSGLVLEWRCGGDGRGNARRGDAG